MWFQNVCSLWTGKFFRLGAVVCVVGCEKCYAGAVVCVVDREVFQVSYPVLRYVRNGMRTSPAAAEEEEPRIL